MKKNLLTIIFIIAFCFFSELSYATLATSPKNLFFSGKILKIDFNKKKVFINNKIFYFKKNIEKELKAFKRLNKTITVKYIEKDNKYYIEKIIFQLMPINKKGRY